jgi:hypothetical protein
MARRETMVHCEFDSTIDLQIPPLGFCAAPQSAAEFSLRNVASWQLVFAPGNVDSGQHPLDLHRGREANLCERAGRIAHGRAANFVLRNATADMLSLGIEHNLEANSPYEVPVPQIPCGQPPRLPATACSQEILQQGAS